MKRFLYLFLGVLCSANAMCQPLTTNIFQKTASDFTIQNTDSLIFRLNNVNTDIETKGIKYFPQNSSWLLTGYSYGEFYDWDLYFENIYMSYYGESDYCFTNLKEFLRRQHLNGFVSRSLKMPRAYDQFKPFLAQIALLGSRQKNDFSWMNEVVTTNVKEEVVEGGLVNVLNFCYYYQYSGGTYYQRLQRYLNFWFWFKDFDKNGLPVWNSAGQTGMDNQFSRAGDENFSRCEGVDLACYLYRELKAMAVIAWKLGFPEDVKMYNEQAGKLIVQINTAFWDEKDGFYYDRDEQTGKPVKVKSVAGFMPLFIGAASKQQAERLVKEHLLNKNEFWTDYPVPSYSKTEPDYDQDPPDLDGNCNWRGTTWIPTNYMVFHGLMDYGYTDIAKELAQKTFDMAFVKNKTTREYYNAETGAGIGLNPFWGWSTLAYFMPFEYELNYNPTDISNEKIQAMGTDILGIPFKNVKKKLEYKVSRLSSPMKIDGKWNKPQWKNVKALEVSNYMDKLPKFRPTMKAKMMYDSDNIYVIFQVRDSTVRCLNKTINSNVWEDNTAEFFFAPDTLLPVKYFNLEINCGGAPLMHYNAVASKEITHLSEEEIKKIEIAHSYTPTSDQERFGLLTWTLEYKIPLNLLEKYSKVSKPAKGVTWRANFYRIAHKSSDPHYASWSFVDIAPDDVQMHLPEFFGVLKFE